MRYWPFSGLLVFQTGLKLADCRSWAFSGGCHKPIPFNKPRTSFPLPLYIAYIRTHKASLMDLW